jgi:phosphoribosyl-ATP pyrophosphohydrolase
MLGYMDREALGATLATGEVHFHSRSRGVLWRKGETSGNVLRLVSIAADCDGDALLVRAHPAGPTCHTGETNCFHSEIASSSAVPAAPRTPRNDAKDEESAASSVLPPAPRTSPNDVEPVQSAEPMWGRRSAPAYSDRRDPTNARGERAPHPRSPLPESPPEARRSDAHDELGGNESVLPGELQAEGLTLAPLFAVLRDRAERRPDGSYTVKLLDNEDKALKKLIEEAGEVALAVKNRDRANLVWELADVLYHLAVIMVAQGVAPADVNAELARRAGERR